METTDIFERAYEALAAEQREKQAKDDEHYQELKALSRGLECKALTELRRVGGFDRLKQETALNTRSLKQAVDTYLNGLRQAMDRKVTFDAVCARVNDMLETKEDSEELQTALFRLLCYEDGEVTEITTNQKKKNVPCWSEVLVKRKYKICHARELKKALAESKRKRPELYALLPALLDLKEKARKAMTETK